MENVNLKTIKHTKFSLGQLVMTRGIDEWAKTGFDLWPYIIRHANGDWGDLGDDDKRANERALVDGSRIFSAYVVPERGKIWIITESTREATTVLKPDEY